MKENRFNLFIAGDAIITLPWSHIANPEFLALVDLMRAADVTIINLETVVHSFRGYAQADSGGTWVASPPVIAEELAWAGVNMVSHANNHAFDYGSEGILETHEHVAESGIVITGSGKDLQSARAPGWFTAKRQKVAHLSVAATFVPYGRASRSRPDLRGRPGINPLTVVDRSVVGIPEWFKTFMRVTDKLLGNDQTKYARPRYIRFEKQFVVGDGFCLVRGRRLDKGDRAATIEAVAQASEQADLTVVSIHSHDESAWLHAYVRDVVEAGANVVHVHGVHEVRGIKLINGCAIFYGLGDFVFQVVQISPLPAQAYEAVGLDDAATPADLVEVTKTWAQSFQPKIFEGCAAQLNYDLGRLKSVALYPIDLQFGANNTDLGRPQLANPKLGKRIIEEIASQSSQFGTKVRYDAGTNTGRIDVF